MERWLSIPSCFTKTIPSAYDACLPLDATAFCPVFPVGSCRKHVFQQVSQVKNQPRPSL